MIDILVPVLNRPERVEPLLTSIRDCTEARGYRVFFGKSPGDDAEEQAIRAAELRLFDADTVHIFFCPWEPGPGDYAKKINWMARHSENLPRVNPFLLLGADDLRFHPGWDTEILAAFGNLNTMVVGTNDLGNKTVMAGLHSTHPAVARAYVREMGCGWDGPGVVYHEGYDHQYCDTELIEVAKQRGVFQFAGRSYVEHLHPFWGKGELDDTYRKGQQAGPHDARLFQSRRKQFG